MIAVYQLLHGKLDLDQHIFFDEAVVRDTRGHPWKLVKRRAISRIRCNAFSIRVINDWNSLLPAVLDADTQPVQELLRLPLVTHCAHNHTFFRVLRFCILALFAPFNFVLLHFYYCMLLHFYLGQD